jgi:Mn-dependent DtxR family transcriptional regulator
MLQKYSEAEIREAALRRGHSEEEIRQIMGQVQRLAQHGLVSTAGGGVSLTRAGRNRLAQLRRTGMMPLR